MRAVSLAYKAAQASHLIFPVRKVEIFRALLDGSGWEASPIDVTSEVSRLERMAWKLDTDALNEFKASNIRIEVDNSDRRWDDSSSGRFAGFLRFHSKLRVSLGLKVGGAEEAFPVFTGVIDDVVEDSGTPTLQLDVRSMDQLLEGADANKAAILITDELLGIGDGQAFEFELSQLPVGEVLEIRVGGEAVRPGTRWTASNLNDPQKKARVRFETVQPAPGAEIRADYIVWKRDLQIHEAVSGLLVTVPQVPAAAVETVDFEPPAQREILHTHEGDFAPYSLHRAAVVPEPEPPAGDGQLTIDPYDAEAEWQAGASLIDKINFKRLPGGIHPRWTAQYEGERAPNVEKFQIENDATFPWSEFVSQGASVSLANSVRTVDYTGTSGFYSLNNQKNDVPFPFWSSRSVACRLRVEVLSGDLFIGVSVPGSNIVAAVKFQNLGHVRVVTNNGQGPTVSVDATQFHVYRLDLTLTSSSTGTYRLFIDGVQVNTGTLGPLSSPQIAQTVELQAQGSSKFHIDFLRFNSLTDAPASGSLTLKVDYGPQLSGLTGFGLITTLGPFFAEIVDAIAAGAQFFWSWSQDDLNYSPETQVANPGNVGSWTSINSPRFIKFRVAITDQLTSTPYGVRRLWLPAIAASPAQDGGSGIVSWDTWKAAALPNDGSVQRFTSAAGNGQFISGSGFSFHRALGPGDSIQTDEFQASEGFGVTRKMVFITLMNTSGPVPPTHNLSVITLTTRNVLITMANYGGRSVLDVLKELARIADFEIGVDGEGSFFFRNKGAAAAPVLTLDESNVERVQNVVPGWDRVFNNVRATFGQFVKTANPQTEGEPAPNSIQRFGFRPLSVGGGSLMFQTDVDLATVMARRYFGRYKEPKRRVTLTARFMPELELGDRVTFDVASPRRVAQPFDARVLGIAHDLMSFRTELDLLEV